MITAEEEYCPVCKEVTSRRTFVFKGCPTLLEHIYLQTKIIKVMCRCCEKVEEEVRKKKAEFIKEYLENVQ